MRQESWYWIVLVVLVVGNLDGVDNLLSEQVILLTSPYSGFTFNFSFRIHTYMCVYLRVNTNAHMPGLMIIQCVSSKDFLINKDTKKGRKQN